MSKRYDEIMDNVEVTAEMRARILSNLQKADLTKPALPKVLRFSSVKRYLSLAACFAVLLVGVLAVPSLWGLGPWQPEQVLSPGADIVEVSSVEALAAAVDFAVEEVSGLPFMPEAKRYTAFGTDMAQITYEGQDQTCTFRKSVGDGDNSGDYNSYPAVETLSAGTVTATLKGTADGFTLALWQDGGFSYSLRLSAGLSAPEWAELIAAVH